jgi:hypothetical protein
LSLRCFLAERCALGPSPAVSVSFIFMSCHSRKILSVSHVTQSVSLQSDQLPGRPSGGGASEAVGGAPPRSAKAVVADVKVAALVGQQYEWRDGGLAEAKRRRGGFCLAARETVHDDGRREATRGGGTPKGGDRARKAPRETGSEGERGVKP